MRRVADGARALLLGMALFVGAALPVSAWAQKAMVKASPDGRVRLVKENGPGGEGKLFLKTGGGEKEIASAVTQFWMADGGRTLYYAYNDRKGRGFENEGQALVKCHTPTGDQRTVYLSNAVITELMPARSKSGKTVLLLTSVDGGLGAPRAAAVDVASGAKWEKPFSRFTSHSGGMATLAIYAEGSPENVDFNNPRPIKTEKIDLDAALAGKVK